MKLRSIVPTALAGVLLLAPISPAIAQFGFSTMVYDPTAVAELITQVNNQVQMLNNMSQQVQQGRAILNPLGSNILPGLSGLAQNTQSLIANLNNIRNSGSSLTSALSGQYPTDFSSLQNVRNILAKLSSMQIQTRSAMQSSMAMQNQIAGNQPQIARAMSSAVTASNAVSGPTAALQATNQILATLSQQISDLQSVLIAHMRAEDTERMSAQSTQTSLSAANIQFAGSDTSRSGIQITNY